MTKVAARQLTVSSNINLLTAAFLGLMMMFVASLVVHAQMPSVGTVADLVVTSEKVDRGQHSDHISDGLHQDCTSQVQCHMQAIVGSQIPFATRQTRHNLPFLHEVEVSLKYPPTSPPPKTI
jgi:hypothetical protein